MLSNVNHLIQVYLSKKCVASEFHCTENVFDLKLLFKSSVHVDKTESCDKTASAVMLLVSRISEDE